MKLFNSLAIGLTLMTLPLAAESNWLQNAQNMIKSQMQITENDVVRLMDQKDRDLYDNLTEEQKALVVRMASLTSEQCMSRMMSKMQGMLESMRHSKESTPPPPQNRFN